MANVKKYVENFNRVYSKSNINILALSGFHPEQLNTEIEENSILVGCNRTGSKVITQCTKTNDLYESNTTTYGMQLFL